MVSKQRQHQLFMSVVDFHGPVNFLGPVSLLGPTVINNVSILGTMPAGLVIAVVASGLVVADSSDLGHAGRVAGVSTGTTIVTSGELSFGGWSFTRGDILYLTPVGVMATGVPVSGFQQRIGVATSSTSVIVSLNDPITLA